MNERIKELYGQAVLFVFENKVGVEGPKETLQEAINEKFAELIVRECANIAYGYDAPKMSGLGMIIAGRIESHFGVEE